MTTERIDIIVREDGARVVRRNLDDIGDAADRGSKKVANMNSVLGQMKSVLAGLGIGYGINEVIKYIDTWANLEGRLKLVTNSTAQLRDVQNQLFDAAQRTRTAYEGTADLYARIARNTQELNATDKERIKVTENINKALVISGSSAQSANAALVQLGQGFASGTLRGEELNSVLEQTPRLAQAIAEGMGKTVGQLRQMGQEGKLTSEAVFKALMSQSDALEKEFAQMPRTISQSFTVLNNELMRFVGEAGQANGVANNFASVLSLIANNLNVLFAIMQGFAALKIAEFFLTNAAAIYKKVAATVADIAAIRAQTAANIAAAESEVALSAARVVLARTTTQLTAATAAHTAATTALSVAQGAAGATGTLAARALGLLGGPIGIVTTLLGLGVTAWSLWGSTAKKQEEEVEQTVYQKTETFIQNMDKQIAKLKERNRLAAVDPTLAKSTSPGADELRAIMTEMDRVGKDATLNDTARTEILRVLGGQYMEVTKRIKEFTEQQDKANATSNADKISSFFAKNKEYLSKTEQLALAIKEAKTQLGDAFTSDVEKKINDYFKKKDAKTGQHDALLAYKASIQDLEMQQKLQREIANGMAQDTETMYKQQLISLQQYVERKTDIALEENLRNIQLTEAELAATKGMGQEQIAARKKYLGELAVLAQQRLNIAQSGKNEIEQFYAALREMQDQQDRADVAMYNDQVRQLERKIELFDELPAVVTRATVAELEEKKATMELFGADQQRIQYIQQKIDALNRLAAVQSRSTKQDFDKQLALDMGNQWKRTADIIGNALTTAFGKGGKAMAQVVQGYGNLKKAEVDLKKQYDDRVKVADGDAKRIRDAEMEYAYESAAARAGAYADMASAAKGFFAEHTAGYKVLEAVEKGYRAFEMAMAIGTMAQKLGLITAVTTAQVAGNAAAATSATASAGVQVAANTAIGTSAAAAGVANQAMGDPYSAWARMAAMAAVMVGLGFAVSGGGSKPPSTSSAEYVQKHQGTGSVFGDNSAKSESIGRSMDRLKDNSNIMLPLTEGMLAALQSIDASMNGLTNIVLRTDGVVNGSNMGVQTGKLPGNGASFLLNTLMGTNAVGGGISGAGMGFLLGGPIGAALGALLGGVVGKALGSLWGSVKQNITDSGIMFGGSVAGLQNGQGYSQYANVETTKKSWFGLSKSTSNSVVTQGLDAELTQQFSLIFSNLEVALKAAGAGLGKTSDDIGSIIDGLTLETSKLSLKGLTGEEMTKAINAVVSKSMDDIAQAVFPGLDAFRKVGEGYAETVMRVSAGVETAKVSLERLGLTAVDYTSVVNKQGDVATEIIRQSIQGVEAAGTGIRRIVDTFSGTATELAQTYDQLVTLRTKLTNAGLNGNFGTATLQGAGGLENLSSGLADFLDNFYSDTERSAMQLKELTSEFGRMNIAVPTTKEQFRDLVKRFDDGTEAGARMVGRLLSMSGAFAEAIDTSAELADKAKSVADAAAEAARDLARQRGSMQAQLLELQGRKLEALTLRRQMELEAMDATLRPLQQQIYAMEDVAEARDNLQAAYERESASLQQTIDKFRDLAKTLREFRDGLLVGDMTTLSPEEKYKAAKEQFDRTYSLAKSGDPDAMARMQSVSENFLNASRDYYASSKQYTTDFEYVRKALEVTAQRADTQASIAAQQLSTLNSMLAGIVKLDTSVLSVASALSAYTSAMSAAASGGGGYSGGSSGGSGSPSPNNPQGGYTLVGNGSGGATLYFPGGGSHSVAGPAAYGLLTQAYGLVTNGTRDGYSRTRSMGGYTPPGRVLVGEDGPEVVDFDRPGRVYTAEQSERMMRGGSNDSSAIVGRLDKLETAVVRELQAANLQRGQAAMAQIKRMGELVDSVDTNTRAMERNS